MPPIQKRDYAVNYMAKLVREGVTPTAGLREFRAAGGRIQTQTWYRGMAEVAASLSKRAEVELAPLHRRPGAEEISQWSGTKRTGYVYQVETYVKLRETGDVIVKQTAFRSNRLVRYGDALAGALDPYEDDADTYGEQVLGGIVTGVYELTGE